MRLIRCALLMAATGLSLSPAVGVGQDSELDEIVAVVNDGLILESEMEGAIAQVRQRAGAQINNVPDEVVQSQVLEQLILRKLQMQRAQRAGLDVSDSELNQAIGRMAAQNGMTADQFMSSVRAEGLSISAMRERLREQILIDKLKQREIAGRVVVTDEDVDRYLESESLRVQENREYRIRHILVSVSENASQSTIEAARDRVEELRERALADDSFSELAVAHSDGQNALEGGDLGWLAGGFLPTLFSDVVPRLQPGEISKPFRGPSGFHLIQLADVRRTDGQQTVAEDSVVKEYQARHILLETNEIRNNERAEAEAERLRKRILAGDDFTQLARENSDDASSANQGGELGWLQADSMSPPFAEQLRSLKPGETSKPFRTDSGWHVLQVQDTRQRDLSQERRRQRARQALGRQKMQEESEIWLRKIRDEAFVDIRLEGFQDS
ncbi:peptidylprolyl isomerase [Spectribacter hydrogenooxidans]|uniref:Chaperone SurA n=1 Tax=Spectribacter hydrogenoxidans TaxID=3075608 RepID=A0ABU3C3C9_9GAMM|nr:peptidylprolyl isomerase [Salinisphaera sp. W335]MDT0636050.1 peptidylprolyl isomerase [Salinisphaera sp. W335]